MRVVVVGGGPVGMFCAMALARQGNDVTVVDRDAGPPVRGTWVRRGVMQFRHPHFFRPIVRRALLESLPDVWDALISAGGIPARPDGMPEEATGLACRRSTFERVLWSCAANEQRLAMRTGHADHVVVERGRATGVSIDGGHFDADLVIAAAGRAGRFADDPRLPGEGGACGFAYVSRMYRARPGVEPATGVPMGSLHRGYLTIVFPQDDRTLCALIVRATEDTGLAAVRDNATFDRVAAAVPELASWTDPDRFEPITDALPGSGLTNTYRAQVDSHGRPAAAGLLFVGDAVCTTNPAAGRGVSLGLQQATTLIDLLGHFDDPCEVAQRLDAWCTDNIRPWWQDHVYWDQTLLRRFNGDDLDIEARIPSDVICAAAQVDRTIMPAAGRYMGMLALPSILDSMQDKARAVLRTGWRPPYAEGPSREELAELLRMQPVA